MGYSILELKKLSSKLKRQPTSSEYDKNVEFGFKRRQIKKLFGLTWNDFCEKYNPEYGFRNYHYKSKEDIIKKIKEFYGSIDYIPTYNDLKENGMPSYNTIQKFFKKTYKEFLNEIGYDIKGSTTISKSDNEMLDDFKKYYEENGIIMTHSHKMEDRYKCYETYIKRFGSIKNICEICGINYDISSLKSGSFGGYYLDNNGNKCNSLIEKEISNYLIQNNIKFEKEYPYSNLIENCKYVFDWKISVGDKNYYIEYFGLYSENSKDEKIIKYTNKVKNKVKLLKENDILKDCILIYPNDYKNKTLDNIFIDIIDSCTK